MVDMDSILDSIKKPLNIDTDDDAFDHDIIMFINGEFMELYQLGIGPANGFSIQGSDAQWSDYTDDPYVKDAVKTYIYLKVKMVFDPPASSVVADMINNKIADLGWRLNHHVETSEVYNGS